MFIMDQQEKLETTNSAIPILPRLDRLDAVVRVYIYFSNKS